jgi:hypothetical protein
MVHCEEAYVGIDEFIKMVKEDAPVEHESG